MPKVVTQRCLEQDLNLRPTDRKPKCLTRCTTAPPKKLHVTEVEIQLQLIRSTAAVTRVYTLISREADISVTRYDTVNVISLLKCQLLAAHTRQLLSTKWLRSLKPRLHDTAGYQTGCLGLTTCSIV